MDTLIIKNRILDWSKRETGVSTRANVRHSLSSQRRDANEPRNADAGRFSFEPNTHLLRRRRRRRLP